MTFKQFLEKLAKPVYFLVGLAGVSALVYMLMTIKTFFMTMGWFGSIVYILVTIGSINWGIKLIKGEDIFGN